MAVHPSGYYAWKVEPMSFRGKDDQRLLGLLKHAWLDSGGVYGYRKLTMDMRDLGETCGKHPWLACSSSRGCAPRRATADGLEVVVASLPWSPPIICSDASLSAPNQSWVTDITYIRTHEGWLYLSAVIDLFSRHVIGWSMGHRIDTELALNALLMALWRRQPKATVTVHSDQGSQFTSHDWQGFLRDHNLVSSMSRRGNCHQRSRRELLPIAQARAHSPTDLFDAR